MSRDVRVTPPAPATPPAPVTHRAKSGATDELLGGQTHELPTPGVGPPRRPTATPTPAQSGAPNSDPFGDVGFKEINEKDWLAGIRDKIAQREKVTPGDVRLSPGFLRAVFVRSSPVAAQARPGRRIPPRHHEIVVVDNQGRRIASFRPIVSHGSDEPPSDLRFLSEERLVYEVIARTTADALPASKDTPAAKAKSRSAARATTAKPAHNATHVTPTAVPPVPPRLFVIQPLQARARPIRCQGFNFTFAPKHDRLAFVSGPAGTAFVAVDGTQVYPRHGRTIVVSAPLWSKDGHSLAFLEQPPAHPARLVLVVELDDPRGDRTWDLPADAKIDGASVFWAGAGKLVVKKSAAMRPIFSTSFDTER